MNQLSKKLVKHIQDLRNLLPQLDWNPWDLVWMIQKQFLPLRPIFWVEILKCLTRYPQLLHWNLRMIMRFICWENELNLKYRIPTEMTPKSLSETRKIFMERKNQWKKIIPGINNHQNIRKTYCYPEDNWKTLARWQIDVLPPAEHSFQILEDLASSLPVPINCRLFTSSSC